MPAPLMPSEPRWPDAIVKQEDAVAMDHEERSDYAPMLTLPLYTPTPYP